MTRWLLRLLVLAGLGLLAWKVWQLLQEGEDHSDEWAPTEAGGERAAEARAAGGERAAEARAARGERAAEARAARGERAAEARAATAPAAHEARTDGPEADATWVKPVGADCPPGYPIKAKTASRVFRVPGMLSYAESKPERCYCNEDAATADGFTRAKR